MHCRVQDQSAIDPPMWVSSQGKQSLFAFKFSQLCIETHGDPRWNFNPFGLKSCFTVVVPGFPWNLYAKLTETLRQIKTTFPMSLSLCLCLYLCLYHRSNLICLRVSVNLVYKFPMSLCLYLCLYHRLIEATDHDVHMICMLLKITGLFCRISSFLQGSFAKETYDFPVLCIYVSISLLFYVSM